MSSGFYERIKTVTIFQLERFWIQSNIVVSLLGGVGFWTLYCIILKKYPNSERGLYATFTIGAVMIASQQVVSATLLSLSMIALS